MTIGGIGLARSIPSESRIRPPFPLRTATVLARDLLEHA